MLDHVRATPRTKHRKQKAEQRRAEKLESNVIAGFPKHSKAVTRRQQWMANLAAERIEVSLITDARERLSSGSYSEHTSRSE